MDNSNKDIWEKHKGKHISVVYKALGENNKYKDFYYNGYLLDVDDKKIIIEDRKLGKIPLSFDNLSLLDVY